MGGTAGEVPQPTFVATLRLTRAQSTPEREINQLAFVAGG